MNAKELIIGHLLPIAVAIMVLWLVYRLLFRNSNRLKFNRFYLLTVMLFSLALPLIGLLMGTELHQMVSMKQNLFGGIMLNEITVTANGTVVLSETELATATRLHFTLWQILCGIYLIGVGVMTLLFLFKVGKIVALILRSPKEKREGYTAVFTGRDHGSFSFLHDLLQKAVGWLLREAGKHDEQRLIDWLSTRCQSMPRTMLRYAIEKFSEHDRHAFLHCYYIRKSNKEDLPVILNLRDQAREIMRSYGNVNQWPDGYPRDDKFRKDIELGGSHVMLNASGEIVGTFALLPSPEVTYNVIYDGQWLDNEPYHVIHRIASTPDSHGVLDAVLDYCQAVAPNIRIDTHEANVIMQKGLKRHGYHYCGIIHLLDGNERMAYQKHLKP